MKNSMNVTLIIKKSITFHALSASKLGLIRSVYEKQEGHSRLKMFDFQFPYKYC
jgi:hypothetical protein